MRVYSTRLLTVEYRLYCVCIFAHLILFQAHLVVDILGRKCVICISGGCEVYVFAILPEER